MVSRIKTVLTFVALYITIVGLVTFSCFLFEEAIQMTTFGTWPAKTAQNWELVLEGCDLIISINNTMCIINYSIGWIQPLAFLSYRAYSKATDYYVKALKSQAFANAPEVFIGRKVRFTFTPKQIKSHKDHVELINRNIRILMNELPPEKHVSVQGILEQQGKLLIVDMRK